MTSYAIVEACGRQMWVEEGKFYDFDKLPFLQGDTFSLSDVLLVSTNSSTEIGQPYLHGQYSVDLMVLRHFSGPKVRVYKMRPKKKTRKTFGHRSKLTRVLVRSISKSVNTETVGFL
jgi:large subunit ribosomal protein L21